MTRRKETLFDMDTSVSRPRGGKAGKRSSVLRGIEAQLQRGSEPAAKGTLQRLERELSIDGQTARVEMLARWYDAGQPQAQPQPQPQPQAQWRPSAYAGMAAASAVAPRPVPFSESARDFTVEPFGAVLPLSAPRAAPRMAQPQGRDGGAPVGRFRRRGAGTSITVAPPTAEDSRTRPAVANPQPAAASESEVGYFDEDLKAILAGRSEPRTPPPPAPASREAPPQRREPAGGDDAQALFDRIGRNMAFANTFRLEPMALNQRFDLFDAERQQKAGRVARSPSSAKPQPAPQLDDLDVLADLDAIRKGADGQAEAPVKSPVPSATPPAAAPVTPAEETQRAEAETEAAPPEQPSAEPAHEAHENKGAVVYDVPPVKAEPLTPAVAAAAMLVAWKRQAPADSASIQSGAGPWADYQDALDAKPPRLFEAWGLILQTAKADLEALHQRLAQHGPLWAAATDKPAHSVVVTGVVPGTNGDKATVWIVDPSAQPLEPRALSFEEFLNLWPGGNGERMLLLAHL